MCLTPLSCSIFTKASAPFMGVMSYSVQYGFARDGIRACMQFSILNYVYGPVLMSSIISPARGQRGEEVLNRLRDMAIFYEFKPGERLSESELALRLGVSRTPVREALTV